MKRIYLLASAGTAALLSACTTPESTATATQPCAPRSESAAFFDAVVANTEGGYRTFLAAFPHGKYSSIAIDLLTTCAPRACASDAQLQQALTSALAIARGESLRVAPSPTEPAPQARAPRTGGGERTTSRLLQSY